MWRDELIDLFARAGLVLGKRVSNCDEIDSPCNKERNFLRRDGEATSKVLGVYWISNEDCIRYRINLEKTTVAKKRRIMSREYLIH